MSIVNPTISPLSLLGSFAPATPAVFSQRLPDPSLLAQGDFGSILKSMLLDVNESQQRSAYLAASFERGEHQDLASAMIAQQKAKLAFQTTLQIRNKLVSAYQEVMNMPV